MVKVAWKPVTGPVGEASVKLPDSLNRPGIGPTAGPSAVNMIVEAPLAFQVPLALKESKGETKVSPAMVVGVAADAARRKGG